MRVGWGASCVRTRGCIHRTLAESCSVRAVRGWAGPSECLHGVNVQQKTALFCGKVDMLRRSLGRRAGDRRSNQGTGKLYRHIDTGTGHCHQDIRIGIAGTTFHV